MPVVRSIRRAAAKAGDPSLKMEHSDINRFLEEWGAKGCVADTFECYRGILERFYDVLPKDKHIHRGSLANWREELKKAGYAPATINPFLSVCNTWLGFMGFREYQQVDQLAPEDKLQPELTRNEYLRLLQTAKILGKE